MKLKSMKFKNLIHVMVMLLIVPMLLGANAWAAAEVDSTDPADKAAGVSVNTTVTATFYEDMDSSTLNTDTFIITAGKGYDAKTVAGTVTYSETVATFTPSDALEYNQIYNVSLTTDIKDAAGNALPAEYNWSFTTESNMPSLITSTDPDDKADDADVNAGIAIIFAQEMDPSTISPDSFYLKIGKGYNLTSVPGTVSYSDMKAIFTPDSPLDYKTAYTATVTDDVRDADGSPLENDYIWTFATKDQNTPTNPEVSSVSPADQAENVSADTAVTVTFSEPMNSSTLEQAFSLGDVAVTMAYDESSNTATYTPTASLENETSYTAVVSTDAKSAAGYPLEQDHTWSFTTEEQGVPHPTITSKSVTSTEILVNFSWAMDPLSVEECFMVKAVIPNVGYGFVAGEVKYEGTTATFTPYSAFIKEMSYKAELTCAKDTNGLSLSSGEWSFTGPGDGPEDTDDDADGYSENEGDCDDTDDTVYPGATEIPDDGIDQDCDGSDLTTDPNDSDDDGDGYSKNEGDCDDDDDTVHPGATEIPDDGVDQDCDGNDLTTGDKKCKCGDPGVTLAVVTGCSGWDDATECTGWHSVVPSGEDYMGDFSDGTQFSAYDCTIQINCP